MFDFISCKEQETHANTLVRNNMFLICFGGKTFYVEGSRIVGLKIFHYICIVADIKDEPRLKSWSVI
jgi:hypothetical protein